MQQADRRGVARGRGRQLGLAQLLRPLHVARVAQRSLIVGSEGTQRRALPVDGCLRAPAHLVRVRVGARVGVGVGVGVGVRRRLG